MEIAGALRRLVHLPLRNSHINHCPIFHETPLSHIPSTACDAIFSSLLYSSENRAQCTATSLILSVYETPCMSPLSSPFLLQKRLALKLHIYLLKSIQRNGLSQTQVQPFQARSVNENSVFKGTRSLWHSTVASQRVEMSKQQSALFPLQLTTLCPPLLCQRPNSNQSYTASS